MSTRKRPAVRKPSGAPCYIDALPDDLSIAILSQLRDLRAVMRAEASCTRMRRVLQASDAIWRYLLQHQAAGYASVELAPPSSSTWKESIRFAVDLPTRLVCTTAGMAGVLPLRCRGFACQFRGKLEEGLELAVRTEVPLPVGGKLDGMRRFTALRSGTAPEGGADATRPVLSQVAYFEVTISNELKHALGRGSSEPCVSVGLATHRMPLLGKHPGWDRHSLAWHGDDGDVYHDNTRAVGLGPRSFGPTFGAGDVVGCGVHLPSRQVFFTLNGSFVGVAYQLPRGSGTAAGVELGLYAAVGAFTHERVSLNHGHQAFAFDPDSPECEAAIKKHARVRTNLSFVLARAFEREAGEPGEGSQQPQQMDDAIDEAMANLDGTMATIMQPAMANPALQQSMQTLMQGTLQHPALQGIIQQAMNHMEATQDPAMAMHQAILQMQSVMMQDPAMMQLFEQVQQLQGPAIAQQMQQVAQGPLGVHNPLMAQLHMAQLQGLAQNFAPGDSDEDGEDDDEDDDAAPDEDEGEGEDGLFDLVENSKALDSVPDLLGD